MLAELDEIADSRARWRFALGSAQALVLAPLTRRAGPIALATAVAGAIAVRVLFPGLGLAAAITMPAALCMTAWTAVTPAATRPAAALVSRAGQVIAIAAIAACPVLAIRLLALYPGRAGGATPSALPVMSVVFGADLLTYVLLALRRPEPLGSWRYSGIPGLAAALATSGVFLLSQPPGGESDNPVVTATVLATAIAAPVAAGALAAALCRPALGVGTRLRIAAGEILWGWLLSGPALFVALMLATSQSAILAEASQPGFISEAHQQGAGSVLAWVSGDDVGGAVVIFAALSAASMLSFLVVHAAASQRDCTAGGLARQG
jgi:hypothetical protein